MSPGSEGSHRQLGDINQGQRPSEGNSHDQGCHVREGDFNCDGPRTHAGTHFNHLSPRAYLNYQSGWVSLLTRRLLQNQALTRKVKSVRTPAHASIEDSEFSQQALAIQADEEDVEYCQLITFRELNQDSRLKDILPPPRSSLSREEQPVRLIYYRSFRRPTEVHLMFPEFCAAECKCCNKSITPRHNGRMRHQFRTPNPLSLPKLSVREQWAIVMPSSSRASQLALVDRVHKARMSYGLQGTTNHTKRATRPCV